jgi:transcriptional regulator with XRE-family HTH domain
MPHFPDIPADAYDGPGFGRALAKLRQGHGWSLREAAKRSSVSHPHLSRLERAEAAPGGRISVATIWHLARAYKVPAVHLIAAMLPEVSSAEAVVDLAEGEPAFAAELARAVRGSATMRKRLGIVEEPER